MRSQSRGLIGLFSSSSPLSTHHAVARLSAAALLATAAMAASVSASATEINLGVGAMQWTEHEQHPVKDTEGEVRFSINDKPTAGFEPFASADVNYGTYSGRSNSSTYTPTHGNTLWLRSEFGARYDFQLTSKLVVGPEVSVGAQYRRITVKNYGPTTEDYFPVYVGLAAAYDISPTQSVFAQADYMPFQVQRASGTTLHPDAGWRAKLTYRHQIDSKWHIDLSGQLTGFSQSETRGCSFIADGTTQNGTCFQPASHTWQAMISVGRSF